jgi:protoporphyrinogen oxidase
MSDPVVILGAGLAGIAAARELGPGCVVLERDQVVGGTARSTQRLGFTFDVTGHWLHLADPEIKQTVLALLGDQLIRVARRAEVHSHGVRTPYPFQANTYGLPANVIADCVLGYFRAREQTHPEPKTFEDFIRQRMGDGIAEHFMIPYNTKLWTVPPSAMAHTWTGRFVPVPTPEEVVLGAITPRGSGHALGYNSSFYYPKQGGIQTLATALAKDQPIKLGEEVRNIDTQAKTVETPSGSHRFSKLISTLPLSELIARIIDAPDSIRDAAKRLRSTSVTYWNVGLAKANAPDDAHWIYFPEKHIPFYRAGSASAALPSLAPAGHRSYYVEVAHPSGTACPVNDAQIVSGMREVGLMHPNEEPVLFERHTVGVAYVIMDDNYGSARKHIMDWLQLRDVTSTGRYGSWTYDSMEGALIQGRDAARRLKA